MLDSHSAGKTCQEVVGVGGRIPIVASLGDAPEAKALLRQFGNLGHAVPCYAIFPAGGGESIYLDGVITADEIVEKLKQAGPSKVKGADDSTAMR